MTLKKFRQILQKGTLSLLLLGVTCVLVYTVILYSNAESLGSGLGTGTGSMVGKAIGSIEGMTVGRKEGTEAGKAEGLSAEDTETEISTRFKEVNNLEVLVASVKLSDFHTIGENKDYASLYLVNGNAVFSVDLSQAVIETKEDKLFITLPIPKGDLYIDNSSVKKVAEYQNKFFNGSAEDGFDAYLNTMKKIQEASSETLNNYDELVASAKQSAVKQVTMLAQSTSTVTKQIHIDFK